MEYLGGGFVWTLLLGYYIPYLLSSISLRMLESVFLKLPDGKHIHEGRLIRANGHYIANLLSKPTISTSYSGSWWILFWERVGQRGSVIRRVFLGSKQCSRLRSSLFHARQIPYHPAIVVACFLFPLAFLSAAACLCAPILRILLV